MTRSIVVCMCINVAYCETPAHEGCASNCCRCCCCCRPKDGCESTGGRSTALLDKLRAPETAILRLHAALNKHHKPAIAPTTAVAKQPDSTHRLLACKASQGNYYTSMFVLSCLDIDVWSYMVPLGDAATVTLLLKLLCLSSKALAG